MSFPGADLPSTGRWSRCLWATFLRCCAARCTAACWSIIVLASRRPVLLPSPASREIEEAVMSDRPTRRFVLTGTLATTCVGLGAGDLEQALAQGQLAPTPACDDGPTVRQTEGPFFKPRSPQRWNLREPGMKGE